MQGLAIYKMGLQGEIVQDYFTNTHKCISCASSPCVSSHTSVHWYLTYALHLLYTRSHNIRALWLRHAHAIYLIALKAQLC